VREINQLLVRNINNTKTLRFSQTANNRKLASFAGLSMGHIYLSHFHPMGFQLHYYNINMKYNTINIIKFIKFRFSIY